MLTVHAGSASESAFSESFDVATDSETVLARILESDDLPSPPAIAIRVVNAAANPDCDPAEINAILTHDPALCAKLLRAANSCLYGLSSPVSSVPRAVTILGLNTIRSLALGLSLSAMRVTQPDSRFVKEFWISAVSGAIFARELAIRIRHSNPEDDLVAGLLKDLGSLLLHRTYPDQYPFQSSDSDPSESERTACGIDHAEVTAAVLQQWNLPPEIVEPIRYHHRPESMPECGLPLLRRARLLAFASELCHLDVVVNHPARLERLLNTAKLKYGLEGKGLVAFLEEASRKIEAFMKILDQDAVPSPDYSAILTSGTEELVRLTVENSRERLSGGVSMTSLHRTPPPSKILLLPQPPEVPAFRPDFLNALPASGCRLGGYHLMRQIGRGAMGVVFKAHEPALQRYVALKMLAPSLAACSTSRQRFLREAQVAASIQHENVVSIHAVCEERGTPYFAMEYVAGHCLEDQVENNGPLPVPALTRLMDLLSRGLAAAHEKNIVHRDIKPANVLIEHGTDRVKITDFGLARVTGEAKLTQAGILVGTPLYMAPEIIEGLPANRDSDLFSLGGLLYYCATGRAPFLGQSVASIFREILKCEPVPPRQVRSELPARHERVILRLLQRDPAERFASAEEVLFELAREFNDPLSD